MKLYKVVIRADKYPTEYTVQASGYATATARAVREWNKRFKGSRTKELSIKICKAGEVLQANDNNKL
jgi:hypothetical protein